MGRSNDSKFILLDNSNSTSTPLGGGATFTGILTEILNYGIVFVNVYTDVASATDGLSIQQSSNGTNWDHLDNYTVPAGGTKNYSINPHSRYLRVVYTNGAGAQSAFRLQTICKINSKPSSHRISDSIVDEDDAELVKAVISAMRTDGAFTNVKADNFDNMRICLQRFSTNVGVNNATQLKTTLFDSVGKEVVLPLTAFGDLRTAELHPQFQGSFEYTLDNTDLNTNTVVDGGTVTQASGMAVVGSSTTTASTALFQSKQHAKYRPGLGGNLRFTALFTSPVAATEQYIGLADETGSGAAFKNGYMIGYDGTTFGFHRFQNDSKITVAQSAWDDPLDGTGFTGMTLDQAKGNIFFIQFPYLGFGDINIYMQQQNNGNIVRVHRIPYVNINTSPSVHNPNFHHTMWVNNKATTSNIIIKSASYAYFVEGKTSFVELHQPENGSGTKQKTTVTAEVAILTVRNKTTYASKTNFIDIVLLGVGASIEASSANNLGTVRIVKNATLGGSPSYADINTSDSVVEIDVAGTTVTGGKELVPGGLAGKNDKLIRTLIDNKIILNPSDTLTIAGSSANSATINAHVTWRELF